MADEGHSRGGGGGGAKPSDSPPPADCGCGANATQNRAQALAAHGRLLYRASMDEEHLDLPVEVAEDGFITDKRVNNVCPRKKDDDDEATHAWSIPPVDTFQVRCFSSAACGVPH